MTDARKPIKRSRASAKKAGTWFERSIADWLALTIAELTGLPNEIDRRVKTGSKDRGDIRGVRRWDSGQPDAVIVIECKSTSKVDLPAWCREAEVERGNDDALAGVVVSKRHGVADPARQWVHMELATLVALLTDETVPAVHAAALKSLLESDPTSEAS